MKRGFTLVELSIVLVIIGLLIGSILVAQSMIHSTKIVHFVKKLQQYDVAITNFKTVYKSIPGDSSFLSPAGDGDGSLSANSTCTGDYNTAEASQVWGHLSTAKMVDKTYAAYSPSECNSGPHLPRAQYYTGASLPGLIYDYNQLDKKAATANGAAKAAYTFATGGGLPFRMNVTLNTADVIPLEQKLSAAYVQNSSSQGLVNAKGAGICTTGFMGTDYPCTDPNANLANLIYYFNSN